MAKRIWFDTDIMIGLPERAPREVDDGITLIMALRQPEIEMVGISIITNIDYGYDVTKKLLGWYNKTGKEIPVYKGSDSAADCGLENEATIALAAALRKEKLSILALGPNTNIATVLKNHPELAGQIEEIAFCIGRTPGLAFKPGLGKKVVFDYNFDRDVESMQVIFDTNIPLVFSGFECSYDLFLGPIDIDRLNNDSEADKWVYDQLVPWIKRGHELFGSEGFIPYDTTPLGYFTHPHMFSYFENIPAVIHTKPNDCIRPGIDERTEKPYLEVSYDFDSKRTVKYAYQSLPGFEEEVIKRLLGK